MLYLACQKSDLVTISQIQAIVFSNLSGVMIIWGKARSLRGVDKERGLCFLELGFKTKSNPTHKDLWYIQIEYLKWHNNNLWYIMCFLEFVMLAIKKNWPGIFAAKCVYLGTIRNCTLEFVTMVGHVQVHQNKKEDLLQSGKGNCKGLVTVSSVVLLHLY